MTEQKSEMDDAQIIELIQSKVTAEDADSGWVVAWLLAKAVPVLKEIANNLNTIDSAIAPPEVGQSVSEELSRMCHLLQRLIDKEGK